MFSSDRKEPDANATASSFGEAMPPVIYEDYANGGLFKIIKEYVGNDVKVSPPLFTPVACELKHYPVFKLVPVNRHLLFGVDVISELQKMTAEIARKYVLNGAKGALDELEKEVKEDSRVLQVPVKINGVKGTLEQIALIRLDCTFNESEGMTERLIKLRKKLLPDYIPEPMDMNLNDWYISTDFAAEASRKVCQDIPNIKEFIVKSLDPPMLVNYKYYLQVLQIVIDAFEILENPYCQLSPSQKQRYLNEVVGTIQCFLPERIRQILKCPLKSFLSGDSPLLRSDNQDISYFKFTPPWNNIEKSLGKDFYYGINGPTNGRYYDYEYKNEKASEAFKLLYKIIESACENHARMELENEILSPIPIR
ncbi:MAG: hypothetical protein ACYCQI_07410 [Gammaproteobacteria bacterium]